MHIPTTKSFDFLFAIQSSIKITVVSLLVSYGSLVKHI